VPAGGEFAFTGLAKEILNRLMAAVVAVTHQGMDGRVRVQEDVTIGVRTGISLGVDWFLAAPGAFALGIRDYGFRSN
jgi:hypothetical protein